MHRAHDNTNHMRYRHRHGLCNIAQTRADGKRSLKNVFFFLPRLDGGNAGTASRSDQGHRGTPHGSMRINMLAYTAYSSEAETAGDEQNKCNLQPLALALDGRNRSPERNTKPLRAFPSNLYQSDDDRRKRKIMQGTRDRMARTRGGVSLQ